MFDIFKFLENDPGHFFLAYGLNRKDDRDRQKAASPSLYIREY
jgi:hypothetical protein